MKVPHPCPPSQGHGLPILSRCMLETLRGNWRCAWSCSKGITSHETLRHLVGLPFTHHANVSFTFCLNDLRSNRIRQVLRDDELGILPIANDTARRERSSHDVASRPEERRDSLISNASPTIRILHEPALQVPLYATS